MASPSCPPHLPPLPPSRTLHVLDRALDQSHDVKAEVEACAEELGSVNKLAKAQIADGATTLPSADQDPRLETSATPTACASEQTHIPGAPKVPLMRNSRHQAGARIALN